MSKLRLSAVILILFVGVPGCGGGSSPAAPPVVSVPNIAPPAGGAPLREAARARRAAAAQGRHAVAASGV